MPRTGCRMPLHPPDAAHPVARARGHVGSRERQPPDHDFLFTGVFYHLASSVQLWDYDVRVPAVLQRAGMVQAALETQGSTTLRTALLARAQHTTSGTVAELVSTTYYYYGAATNTVRSMHPLHPLHPKD